MAQRATLATSLLVLTALYTAIAAPATAEGLNLRWGECVADGGLRNLAFACNTNAATRVLAPSFILPAAFPAALSALASFDVTAADLVLPAWWDFKNCRSGSLRFEPLGVAPLLCGDWSGGCPNQTGGIVAYVLGTHGANTASFQVSARRGCTWANDLASGLEYTGPPVLINSTRTVGTPSCAGCDVGVCLELVSLQLSSSAGPATILLTTPANGTDSHRVTWQGVGFTGPGSCQAATPVRKSGWGSIKSLYR